jgi:hypothetical protein
VRAVTLTTCSASAEDTEACDTLAAQSLAVPEPDLRRLIAALRSRQTRFTKNAALCAHARNHRGEAVMRERDASQRLLELLSALETTLEHVAGGNRPDPRPLSQRRNKGGPARQREPSAGVERTHLPTGSL